MAREVRIASGRVLKRLAPEVDRDLLVARTAALIAAGVPTPEARAEAAPDEVSFPALGGETGLAILALRGGGALPTLLTPLAKLHAARLDGLPAFYPARRIAPRLGANDGAVKAALARGLAEIARHGDRLARTLHGDFHARQLIVTPEGAQILDLDDLSRGPVEVDLGNFAAHLASSRGFAGDGAAAALERWLALTLAAYPGSPADESLGRAHARVALLRRGVKLREREGDDAILRAAVVIMAGA